MPDLNDIELVQEHLMLLGLAKWNPHTVLDVIHDLYPGREIRPLTPGEFRTAMSYSQYEPGHPLRKRYADMAVADMADFHSQQRATGRSGSRARSGSGS